MNTHGTILRITTFGESHWPAMWVIIDWFPVNITIDMENLRMELSRRKPGQSDITTPRQEDDENFEILSGLFEWKSTGHPITIITRNTDQKSWDYEQIKNVFRPNHADLTYHIKYGIRDHRWGGRSSWRETVSRVMAWALAKQFLKEKLWIQITAFTKKIWPYEAKNHDMTYIENNKLRTSDSTVYPAMIRHVEQIKSKGDSIWWIIECHCTNVPTGLWEPVFDKIKSRLAWSMLSIWWVLGFEYWTWFGVTALTGSTYNEWFINDGWKIRSKQNSYGWILGWISTGEDIIFRVAVKPTSSIHTPQKTVDINGNTVDIQVWWRHDPCILPRVIPVIEAMAALDIMDLYLIDNASKI